MGNFGRWANPLLLLLSSFLACGLAEGLLRAADLGFPEFYRADPITGSALLPGAAGWFRREGESYVRISSQGLRDREHTIPKPAGAFRVAVLGDSYAEAMQVPMEDAFWAVMERDLAACPAMAGRTPEAVNFGVSGYGTDQEYLTLLHKVPQFEPDFVVLAFLTGNDLRNNVRSLEQQEIKPYFLLSDGRLELDDSFLRSAAYLRTQSPIWPVRQWVLGHSHLAQLVFELRRRYMGWKQRNAIEPGLDETVYREPVDPRWKEAWAVTEALVAATAQEANRQSAGFLMVTLTNDAQVNPDPAVSAARAARLGVPDLVYPDRRLARFAEGRGIPVLTLVDPLRAAAREHHVCLHGFPNASPCAGHWNREGHRLAGELIARGICEMLGGRSATTTPISGN